MITTQCVTCNKQVLVAEPIDIEKNDRKWPDWATCYWTHEPDGSKRYYCDAYCGLVDYEKK